MLIKNSIQIQFYFTVFICIQFLFLLGLENLSPELTRNLKLMHELDQRVQGTSDGGEKRLNKNLIFYAFCRFIHRSRKIEK